MTLDHEAIRISALIWLLRCKVFITPEKLAGQIAYTTGYCVKVGVDSPKWWIGGFSTRESRIKARE